MAHVQHEDLYPLFYALFRHTGGEARVPNLKIGEELDKVLRRTPGKSFAEPPLADDEIPADRLAKILKHAQVCIKCQILVYEDGPSAQRTKSQTELAEEATARLEEERKLTQRFYISGGFGLASFVGANFAMSEYRKSQHKPRPVVEGPVVRAVEKEGFEVHPLQILFLLLILLATWGIAEAWRIANMLWLDYTKMKEAVPVIGKRWAARSRRRQGTEPRPRR